MLHVEATVCLTAMAFCTEEDCSFQANTKDQVELHVALHHHIRTILRCLKCFKVFDKKHSLVQHLMQTHYAQSQKYENDDFMKYHTEDECSVCRSKFASTDNLTKHLRRTHLKTLRPSIKDNSCAVCDHSFRDAGKLKRHLTVQHLSNNPNKRYRRTFDTVVDKFEKTDEGAYVCKHCRASFPDYDSMCNHWRSLKPLTCSECDMKLCGNQRMVRHMEGDHGISSKTMSKTGRESEALAVLLERFDHCQDGGLICKHCKKQFPHHSPARRHLLYSNPLTCDKCDEHVCGQWSLALHMEEQHGVKVVWNNKRVKTESPPKDKGFPCQHCSKVFLKGGIRRRHNRSMAPVICPLTECANAICGEWSLYYHLWKDHEMEKSVAKKWAVDIAKENSSHLDCFPCKYCHTTYTTKVQLQRHIKLRSKIMRCTLCRQFVCNQYSLKRHMAKKHKADGNGVDGEDDEAAGAAASSDSNIKLEPSDDEEEFADEDDFGGDAEFDNDLYDENDIEDFMDFESDDDGLDQE